MQRNETAETQKKMGIIMLEEFLIECCSDSFSGRFSALMNPNIPFVTRGDVIRATVQATLVLFFNLFAYERKFNSFSLF